MATPEQPQVQLNPVASLSSLSFYWGPPSTIGPNLITGYQLICSSINFVQNFTSTACYAQVSSLTNTTDLVFQLAAKNINGTGPFTPFLSAEPGTANAGVGVVTASTVNFNTALVQWSFSTNQNEGLPNGFAVSAFASTFSTLVYTAYPNESSIVISNLAGGIIDYRFSVLPVNDAGWAQSTAQALSPILNFSSFTFNPLTIPSLYVWLDGSDTAATLSTVTDGVTLSTWFDKSTRKTNATAVLGTTIVKNNIQNGLSVVRMNKTQRMDLTMAGSVTNYSVFSVQATRENTGNWQRMIHGNVSGDGILLYGCYSGTTNFFTGLGNGGWNDLNANTPSYNMLNTFVVGGITFTGSSNLRYVNGNPQAAKVTFTPASWNSFSIGCQAGLGQAWNGDIGEILFFNTNLNTNARQTVEGYLAWKWGLQSNLPVTHPYYSTRPNAGSPIV